MVAGQAVREAGTLEACHSLCRHVGERLGRPLAFDAPSFKEVAIRVRRPAEEVVADARKLGVHPGYPLGRDYAGMEDVLMVAVTEKRTAADIDRLAAVLDEVGA